MDISANWRMILEELDSTEPDYDNLRGLLEDGLNWFGASDMVPKSLPVSVANCQRIYASLLDRCNDID